MEIYIWQAWASNNSGSYTMVGSFEKPEEAAAVAETLQKMAIEHGAWTEQGREGESPLDRFCKAEGLNWKEGIGTWDDWPSYDEKDHPEIFVVGHQIFVVSAYTISLPTTFAEYILRKGGRVATEIDHAHHPVVCTIKCFWPSSDGQRQEKMAAFVQKIKSESTILSQQTEGRPVPRYYLNARDFLTIYVVFNDLVKGIRGLADFGIPHLTVDVTEALSEDRPLQAYQHVSEPLWGSDERTWSF